MYGYGVWPNKETAVYWYKKSAEQGDEVAQYNLGCCYANGEGVSKSKSKAREWFAKSYRQGYEPAKKALDDLYD